MMVCNKNADFFSDLEKKDIEECSILLYYSYASPFRRLRAPVPGFPNTSFFLSDPFAAIVNTIFCFQFL